MLGLGFVTTILATWSVIATDQTTGQVGAAVTSCVGSLDLDIAVTTAPGFGIVDAQATFDPAFRGRNLAADELRTGEAPAGIIADITRPSFDDDAGVRQFAVVDLQGRAAAYTGPATLSWSGDRQRNDGRYAWSTQGNILTSEKVVNQASDAFEGCDLAGRLMNAIEAGQANGEGDHRCTPSGYSADSAFLLVVGADGGVVLRLDVTSTSPASAPDVLRPQFDAWRAAHPCPIDRVPASLGPSTGCGATGGGLSAALLLLLLAARRGRKRLVVSSKWIVCHAALLMIGCAAPSRQSAHGPASGATSSEATRQRFLEMFARSYFPGRTGQLLIVPREGDFIARDRDLPFMHGSPWAYDVSIPMLFAGPAVLGGTYSVAAAQQDVAPTLAAALGVQMPPTSTGHVLPVLKPGMARPRVVMLIVLDGMRRDYFDRYADSMPTLTSLRQRGAWFPNAQLDILPSNTAVGHSTIATGTDPAVHGVTGVNVYDRVARSSHEMFAGAEPRDLMALTLADVWQFATSGRAIIVAQGSIDRAATPLAGHGACQLNGTRTVLASYDQRTGGWSTNQRCYRLPAYLEAVNSSALWAGDREWLHHRIDTPVAVRHSALFPAFEADAMVAMIDHEALGEDDVTDLILLNYKGADFVGHKYGPDSEELRVTLGEMDRHLARVLGALGKKVGEDYLLAVTADHGMPSEPSSSDRRHYAASIVDLLNGQFDPGEKQLVTAFEPENLQIFLDQDRLTKLGLTPLDLARFLRAQPFLFWAFTNDEVRQAATGL